MSNLSIGPWQNMIRTWETATKWSGVLRGSDIAARLPQVRKQRQCENPAKNEGINRNSKIQRKFDQARFKAA